MTRRTLLGALKCAFRELRRELDTILAIAAVDWREMGLVEQEGKSVAVVKFLRILSGSSGLAARSERARTRICARGLGPDMAGATNQRVHRSYHRHPGNVTTSTRPYFLRAFGCCKV